MNCVKFTRGRVLAVGVVLAIVVVAAITFAGASSSRPTKLVLGSPIEAVFHRPIELVGACAEARIDHGHDVDSPGLIDQENDECFPAQHAKRAPDGQMLGG